MRTHPTESGSIQETPRTEWTPQETRALVGVYSLMLSLSADGMLGAKRSIGQTPKSALVSAFILEHAPHRSKGSVESKLMNLSAVRQELGLPIVPGYKPLSNVSESCRQIGRDAWTPAGIGAGNLSSAPAPAPAPVDSPQEGSVYRLTAGPGEPCVLKGDSWEDSKA